MSVSEKGEAEENSNFVAHRSRAMPYSPTRQARLPQVKLTTRRFKMSWGLVFVKKNGTLLLNSLDHASQYTEETSVRSWVPDATSPSKDHRLARKVNSK